jgi:hypothetical protein
MKSNIDFTIMRVTYTKLASCILFSFILVVSSPKTSHSIPTKWEDANVSMSALLDSGWQIISHGFTRVAASNTPVSSGFDEKAFTFLLANGRKYIICFSDNPKPPIANASSCRKLN